jgi:hypothetical protein
MGGDRRDALPREIGAIQGSGHKLFSARRVSNYVSAIIKYLWGAKSLVCQCSKSKIIMSGGVAS